MEYYLNIKMNEVLTQITTWMNLQNVGSVAEASHKISHIILLHLCEMPRIGKLTRDRK